MRISVVIDNFNYERYLSDAIDSALAQTWPNLEVIVVDDGSTDGSRAVIEFYGKRIKSVIKTNGGQSSALREGLAQSTGEVVIFLDADDTIEADTVTQVAAKFKEEPLLSRVQWPLQTIDANGRRNGPIVPNPSMMTSGDLQQHIIKFRTHVWPAMSGNAYARWALDRLMPVPEAFRNGCDLYLAETTALLGPIASLSDIGGSYRVHGDNNWATHDLDAEYLHQKIEWTLASHEQVRKVAAELGLDCPDEATKALDVAFICQRLGSLRLDPKAHPLPDDARIRLVTKGMIAAIRHPHHTRQHKAKRIAWLVGTGIGPPKLARRLIKHMYFRPTN